MKQALADFVKEKHEKNEKIVILVDMDNTIVDYSTPIAKVLSEQTNVPATYDNWSDYVTTEEARKIQKDKQQEDHFFYSLQPIPGALDALKEMDKMGFTIFIVSSPSVSSNTCHSDKVRWLRTYLGETWARKLVLTKDKTIVMGDFLIDDKEEVEGIADPKWTQILFSQHYNEYITDRPRITNWNEWYCTILKEVEKKYNLLKKDSSKI